MNKIGLALSGGGFRAALHHPGLVRFLRHAGFLAKVTHITSVSGGSISAAHLGLNWTATTAQLANSTPRQPSCSILSVSTCATVARGVKL
jgi:predicted acylesterase/phospholipase RssA